MSAPGGEAVVPQRFPILCVGAWFALRQVEALQNRYKSKHRGGARNSKSRHAGGTSVGIEILGNALTDGEEIFWQTEPENLRRQFETIERTPTLNLRP